MKSCLAVVAAFLLSTSQMADIAAGVKAAKPAVVTGVKGATVCCQKKGATWKR
jgi:hypothetical protein